MKNLEQIQKTLDYIEENLKTDITLEELSAIAGFSPFHYCRLFRRAVGLGTAQYLARRRLLWAAYDIAHGMKIIDAALSYGFDTASGFCRAFSRTFGCAPSVYAARFRAREPYRIHLLQEEHIMLSEKKLRSVLAHWNMQDERITNTVYSSGHLNENCFSVGDAHFLKVYTNPAKVQLNLDIAAALDAAGIGAALPLAACDGTSSYCDGELYFTLTRRVPGQTLSARNLLAGTAAIAPRSIGVMIGRLHRVLEHAGDIPARDRDIFAEVREQWFDRAREALALSESFAAAYLAALEGFSDLPVQLIHRDPNPGNILADGECITGFVDFDLSQRSIRLFDPCYAATGVLVESGSEYSDADMGRWISLWHEILDGYDAAVGLTETEKRAAKYVLLAIQFICVGYFTQHEKFVDLARTNIRMTQAILAHWDNL